MTFEEYARAHDLYFTEDYESDEFQIAREAWDQQQQRIDGLEQWIASIADDHPQIPDWIQQSARSLLAQEEE